MQLHVMTGGRELRAAGEFAKAVESAGLDGVVVTEAGRTAYLQIAAMALTSELEYSTGVAVAFPRSPMVTAATAWELQDAARGKFRLGLGTQVKAHIERRYGADFSPPGPRLREHVEAIKHIFTAFRGDEKLDYEGEFVNLSLLPRTWSPGAIEYPDPPVDIAAVGPWMTRMAGAVADGVHVHPFHHRPYLDERFLPGLLSSAEDAGRTRDDFTLTVPVFTIVGDTPEERAEWRERARFQAAFYGSTKNYGFMFDMLGAEGTSAKINEKMKAGDMAGMGALITDDMLEHFAIECTWDELGARLKDKYDGIADRLVIYFAEEFHRKDPTALWKFGEVAQELR